MSLNKKILIFLSIVVIAGFVILYIYKTFGITAIQKIVGKTNVAEVVSLYGPSVRKTLRPYFLRAGINYPPRSITLIAIKNISLLEVWASNSSGKYSKVKVYRIKKLSGESGPKLREGDRQVPEGIYKINYLNANSSYHLSMKINYPNAFDLKKAKLDNRINPGSDIFIHGKAVSIGCLAMGDKAIEELFVLAHDVKIANMSVIIVPHDFRKLPFVLTENSSFKPLWKKELYLNISKELNKY